MRGMGGVDLGDLMAQGQGDCAIEMHWQISSGGVSKCAMGYECTLWQCNFILLQCYHTQLGQYKFSAFQ